MPFVGNPIPLGMFNVKRGLLQQHYPKDKTVISSNRGTILFLTRRTVRHIRTRLALLFLFLIPVAGLSQLHFGPASMPTIDATDRGESSRVRALDTSVLPRAPLPFIAPDLALRIFESQGQQQVAGLQAYTDDTLVIAELADTAQRGAFELQRAYTAPRSLKYKPLMFTGDTFVKSNVITRVLQSEVDYVEKGDPSLTALSEQNYKFSYKGDQLLSGETVHVYQVKPRHKRVGLFKGHIYLDAQTGNLLRSEGTIEKSPSFFVRKIDFVQDCAAIGRYTFPIHLHTTAKARLLGKVVLDVYHRDYQPQPLSASLPRDAANIGQ